MVVDGRVLLLNASEEILDVISWRRGACLLLQDKARRPHGHEDEYEIPVVDGVFRLPTALVLISYVHVPYKRLAVNKENVLRRDGYECQYCGRRLTSASGTIDHVVPQSKGGKHMWANVVAACSGCNGQKADRTPLQAGMKLRCRPYVPTRDAMVIRGASLRSHRSWERWVMT